jgi:hypothetical protein
MVINEWNCVSGSKTLAGGVDTYFGNVKGNGDNWLELAVVQDHLDIRGWIIQWDNADPANGSLTFTNNSIWSDLRQGTIIGLHENDTDNDGTGGSGVLASDIRYNPVAGDWDILASIVDTSLIVKNSWKVDNNDWEARILDASNNVIQGYVGESASVTYKTASGLGSDEVGALINGPNVDSTSLSYKDKSTSSTFLSPNIGQDFSGMRNAVLAPEPGTVAMLFSGLMMAWGLKRYRRKE